MENRREIEGRWCYLYGFFFFFFDNVLFTFILKYAILLKTIKGKGAL
jgi:hypothetical protein